MLPVLPGHPHLLGCKQLALVLADHCVAPGHLAVLVPRHGHQEVAWVGQAIGSWKEREVTKLFGQSASEVRAGAISWLCGCHSML